MALITRSMIYIALTNQATYKFPQLRVRILIPDRVEPAVYLGIGDPSEV